MIDIWEWFNEKEAEYEEQKDKARLAMAQAHTKAMELSETDPRGMIARLRRGRAQARALREPWWVFLFDVWEALGHESYVGDLQRGLKQSLHCVHESRKPVLRDHPWRLAAYNTLLICYIRIDALGYAAAIQQSLRELAREVPAGPNAHRYVMMAHQRDFLIEQGKFKQAEKNALRVLDMFDEDYFESDWYTLSPLLHLCWLGLQEGDWDKVRMFAGQSEEVARAQDNAQFEIAKALAWQALAARHDGDEARARRCHRQAMNRMKPLKIHPDEHFFDALAAFHELGEDLDQAVQVRDRQLGTLKGMSELGAECDVHIKRCELLAKLGRLSRKDLDGARQALAPLKAARTYQMRIRRLEKLATKRS